MKCVYFIFEQDECQDKCKIGSTKRDIRYRFRELQTANPNDLYVHRLLYTEYHKQWEIFLHFIFKCKRIKGEWYDLSESDIDIICDTYELYCNQPPPKFIKNVPTSNKKRKIIRDDECDDKKTTLLCDRCDRSFSSKKRLDNHLTKLIPCNSDTFVCNNCSHVSRSTRSYRRHRAKCYNSIDSDEI